MKIIYAQEEIPEKRSSKTGYSIFLAGPTPRADTSVPSWRSEMIQRLEKLGSIVREVLVPEPRNGIWAENYDDQTNWEETAIDYSDILVFWVPRDIKNGMPVFTTNVEFGWWLDKKERLILGFPPNADKCRYLAWRLQTQRPEQKIASSMDEVVEQVRDIDVRIKKSS